MSREMGGHAAGVKRPRALERARVGWPRPLRELKDLLYEVYLAAGAPALDEITEDVEHDDDLPGSPRRDTVRRCISDSSLPAAQADAVSVARVLARRARWDEQDLAQRVRNLWVAARMAAGAGRPISEFDDRLVLADLEVHPALHARAKGRLGALPAYVSRAHDEQLQAVVAAATAGHSGIAVLVGGSSTGKSRALWEAARQLPATWRLWHPINPTRPDAALAELPDIAPRTVVWLNEAQHYLEADPLGEHVAAGLRDLLHHAPRGPVLVLATLWPEHWHRLTTRTDPDRHAHARELLDGHKIDVPDAFAPADLAALAGTRSADPRLAHAAEHAQDHQVTQYLAGVPVLTARYLAAQGATRALIYAAMDARRFGAGPHIPLAWLADAAPGYLTDTEWNKTGDDWLAEALDYVTQECTGIPGILTSVKTTGPRNQRSRPPSTAGGFRRTAEQSAREAQGPHFQLADYLDQYGRRHRTEQIPPIDFWTAAAIHAHPADLGALGDAAWNRGLYRDAAQLHKQATVHGSRSAPVALVSNCHALHPTDTRPAQWAVAHVVLDDPYAVGMLLVELREAGADRQVAALLARDPAAHVTVENPYAVGTLIDVLREAGAGEQAAALAERAAAHIALDDSVAVGRLLGRVWDAGADEQAAALLARDPATHVTLDDPYAVGSLIGALREAGADEQVATLLARDPATHVTLDSAGAVGSLIGALREAGADEQAAALAEQAAAHVALDNPRAVGSLIGALREAGADEQVAALLARDPATHVTLQQPYVVGWARAVGMLSGMLREVGADEQAAALAERAAAHVALDDSVAVVQLIGALREAGADRQVAALLARDPAAHVTLDDPYAVGRLLSMLREAGADEQVAALLGRDPAAHVTLDDPYAVVMLFKLLLEAGADEQAAILLARDPATHVTLDSPAAVGTLLGALREAGAEEQAASLAARFPAAGHFAQFIKTSDHRERFRFGREPDGSAAPSWAWDDLE